MNNYDQSSKGVNLELSLFWDNERSSVDFDNAFTIVLNNSYSQNAIYVFSMFGNLDVSNFDLYGTENFDINVTGKKLIRLFYNHVGGSYRDLLSVYCNWFSMSDLSVESVTEFIYDYYQCKIERCEFLEGHFTCNYQKLVSRGYSQGDYAEIIIPLNVLDYIKREVTTCNSMTFEEIANYYQDEIDHLIWDSPLYARLEIDQAEFYLDDFQKDQYSYDKQEVIDHVKTNLVHGKLDYIITWLGENLPDQPSYI